MLKLAELDDPILRKKIIEVKEVNDDTRKILDDICEYLENCDIAMALAANQLGIDQRIIVISRRDELIKLINPKVIHTEGAQELYEGCVSIERFPREKCKVGLVERPNYLIVEALNEFGEEIIFEANGMRAQILGHEIDHLDGIMFTDRMQGELLTFETEEEKFNFHKEHPLKVIKHGNINPETINKIIKKA